MEAKDVLLARAKEGPSEAEVETRYRTKLQRQQQVAALETLTSMAEWKVFVEMIQAEELNKWENMMFDPTALQSGVLTSDVTQEDENGRRVTQPVTSPVDGFSHALRQELFRGLVWGVRNVLSFPERASKGLQRALEREKQQEQLRLQTDARKPTVPQNPVSGGR